MKKLVIVGNCQARPLKQIIEGLTDQVEVIATPIVHLLKDHEQQETYALLDSADIIITQQIADNYPCQFIQTKHLQSAFPNKVKTIVNLFYSGYTPDWLYIRVPGKGTLRGPMGDYHNKTIIDGWIANKTIEEVSRLLFDVDYNKSQYGKLVEESLAELRMREQAVDVKIVDFILHNQAQKRLFYTFNHPCLYLLDEYSKRILRDVFQINDSDFKRYSMNEPLNQFIPPLNPGVGFSFPVSDEFKGLAVDKVNGSLVEVSTSRTYSTTEIVNIYFSIYDQNSEFIRSKYDC